MTAADIPALVLADTSAWIEFLRGTGSRADRALAAILATGGRAAVSGVIIQEVLAGCRGDGHATEVESLLRSCVAVEPVCPETYAHGATLYRRCRAQGKSVRGTVDCLIAALALEHDLPVLAQDRDMRTLASVAGVKLWPVEQRG